MNKDALNSLRIGHSSLGEHSYTFLCGIYQRYADKH